MGYLTTSLTVASLLLCIFDSAKAHAALEIQDPVAACGLMKEQGLRTRSWQALGGDEYGCASPYKEIGTGNPLANNLAYYVTGTLTRVTELKLVLNVNNHSTATSGHSALLKATKVLSKKVTGGRLPKAVGNAVTAGKPAVARVGEVVITVLRKEWPTGRGYEIHVVLE